mmetsp:Transcript_8719/g.13620  ORF Transcript_8719/g.13620 Transcript_8719/m.13620 type:complete len:484 (+) Transcript_8719:1-1452(+)
MRYSNCIESYFEQQITHFGPSPGVFQQRYFVNDDYYDQGNGTMFFYLGNEADVTLYVNATGLMWENAEEFRSLVVFAEHRYYGKSQLFPDDPLSNLQYLSAEQAIMDYVNLVDYLKEEYDFDESSAVIGFGGSYGGMLASWARFHYPNVWDGAIAASAPIVTFEGLEDFFDPHFFNQGIMYDISTAAGVSSKFCEKNLRKVFIDKGLEQLQSSSLIRSAFQLCQDDNTTNNNIGRSATQWLNNAIAYMSMGNFPYSSGYILNNDGVLPAFPVRVACEYLAEDLASNDRLEDWLAGLASFAGVYYNYSKTLPCNRLSAPVNRESFIVETLWDYQYCTQIFQVGGKGPDNYDMYWNETWNANSTARRCVDTYGFYPDRFHFASSYGTPLDWARDSSNIVWSQGEYDPWRGGGVMDDLSESLLAFVIPQAAHHLDLFFSHENDTDAVVAARQLEMNEIRRWIQERKERVKNHNLKKKVSSSSTRIS